MLNFTQIVKLSPNHLRYKNITHRLFHTSCCFSQQKTSPAPKISPEEPTTTTTKDDKNTRVKNNSVFMKFKRIYDDIEYEAKVSGKKLSWREQLQLLQDCVDKEKEKKEEEVISGEWQPIFRWGFGLCFIVYF